MKEIIADEDIPRPVVEKLRSKGFNIFYIEEEMKNATDKEVLQKSHELRRPILTFDSDFQNFDNNNGVLHITKRTRYRYVVKAVEDILKHISRQEVENSVVKINPSDYR